MGKLTIHKVKKEENKDGKGIKSTILGTSEESNFILNMTEKTIDKLTFGLCGITIAVLTLIGIVPEFSQMEVAITVPATAFTICGVFAFFIVLITAMKKMFPKKLILPAIIWGIILILATISAFTAFNFNQALKGVEGRGEGLLSLCLYALFWFLGVKIARTPYVRNICDVLIGVGLFQCIFVLMQIIRPISKFCNFFYSSLLSSKVALVYLPNGTMTNPIIFAQFMTFLGAIATCGAISDSNKIRRVIYTISAVLFAFFAVKTSTLAGLIGGGVILVTGTIFGLKNAPKGNLKAVKVALIAVALGLGVLADFTFPKLYKTALIDTVATQVDATSQSLSAAQGADITTYKFYDKGVIWADSQDRVATTGFLEYSSIGGRFSPVEGYKHLWAGTMEIITESPKNVLIGVGEEQLLYSQTLKNGIKITNETLMTASRNTFDKPYNDILYIVATRGIFALVGYILIVWLSLKGLFKPKRVDTEKVETVGVQNTKWTKNAVFAGITAYLLFSLISFSAISVAPIFFLFLGFSAGRSKVR
jgi:hypothetical protein